MVIAKLKDRLLQYFDTFTATTNRLIREQLLKALFKLTTPSKEFLVCHIVSKVAGLALPVTETRLLPPVSRHVHGPITLSGNSLPVFTYIVFDKPLMDFISVRVEVALPDRISFIPMLIRSEEPLGFQDTPMKPEYREPFDLLARHLWHYFPLTSEQKGGAL